MQTSPFPPVCQDPAHGFGLEVRLRDQARHAFTSSPVNPTSSASSFFLRSGFFLGSLADFAVAASASSDGTCLGFFASGRGEAASCSSTVLVVASTSSGCRFSSSVTEVSFALRCALAFAALPLGDAFAFGLAADAFCFAALAFALPFGDASALGLAADLPAFDAFPFALAFTLALAFAFGFALPLFWIPPDLKTLLLRSASLPDPCHNPQTAVRVWRTHKGAQRDKGRHRFRTWKPQR